MFSRFWPRPAILLYDPGLAASPRARCTLGERSDTLLHRRLGIVEWLTSAWRRRPPEQATVGTGTNRAVTTARLEVAASLERPPREPLPSEGFLSRRQ
jgi:hypothetical protein